MPAPKSTMRPIRLTKEVRALERFNESTGQTEVDRLTVPCIIDANTVRCHYPRVTGHPGTRITFKDGGGFAVLESPDQVSRLVYGDAEIPFVVPDVTPTSHQLEHQPEPEYDNRD